VIEDEVAQRAINELCHKGVRSARKSEQASFSSFFQCFLLKNDKKVQTRKLTCIMTYDPSTVLVGT
jgi:hypothetical protein